MEVVSPIPSCSPPSPPKNPASPSGPSSYVKRSRGHSASSPPRSSLLARRTSKPDLLNSLLKLSPSSASPSSSPPLSRASSALNLLYNSQSQPHTPGEGPSTPPTGAHASAVVSMSPATATGTLRAPRKGSSAALSLPFVPLTPIMASPRLTPEIGAGKSEDRAMRMLAADGEGRKGEVLPREEEVQAGDYLTLGGQMAVPSLSVTGTESVYESSAPPTPTWTSTPPTPPPKLLDPSPVLPSAQSRSRSRSRSARPASVSVVPLSRSSSSPSRARPSASLPSSSSLASTSTARSTTTVRGRHHSTCAPGDPFREVAIPRRRMSLPPSLSKSVSETPATSRTGTASSSPARQPSRLHERTASPLRASVVAGHGSVSKKSSARKLFTLDGDTEGSDGEEERERVRAERRQRRLSAGSGQRPSRERSRHEERLEAVLVMEAERDFEREAERTREYEREREEMRMAMVSEAEMERLRAGTRRYHALMELLATEVGYLMDLRALVTVYLEQLPTLSTASAPPSSTSALSLPALGLARSLPSSRSSFLHPSSAPSPSASANAHIGLGSDSGHGPPKDKDKEKAKDYKREKSRERKDKKDKGKDGPKGSREKDKMRQGGKDRELVKEKELEGDDEGAREGDLKEREKENMTLSGHGHEPHHERKGSKDESSAPPLPHSQKNKHVRRPIFAEKDVRAVCRNANELLRFHDQFVRELREAVCDYGLARAFVLPEHGDEERTSPVEGAEPVVLERIDEAVSVVAEKFINQAPSFSIYEVFCPGHSEAANLIRNVQEHYPMEWDAYEQRCSLLVSHAVDLSSISGLPDTHSDDHSTNETAGLPSSATTAMHASLPFIESSRKKRRHSTSSLAMLSSPSYAVPIPRVIPESDASEPERKREHSSSSSGHGHKSAQSQATRLKFLDYLIKPVQRICRYPLLLDQLKMKRARTLSAGNLPSRAEASMSNGEMGSDAVDRASEAMRLVVSLVDHASETQAHLVRSALIASRMILTHPTVSPTSSSSGSASRPNGTSGRVQGLTPEFVASLGPCRLAGALDVVHHPSALHAAGGGALRAKYLGTFLYGGGYVVLVKIPKSGKVYEPRYWFSLVGFELLDFEDDDPSLPFSFHLCGHGHHLQFAAACHNEKVIWMSACRNALTVSPRWTNEPVSSLQADNRPQSTPAINDGSSDPSITALPTIQSLSELEGQDDQTPEAATRPKARSDKSKLPSRLDAMSQRQEQQMQAASFAALSRRSSTASVKAFFSQMNSDPSTRIARPSSQVRQHVDQGLHDVFSEQCLAARSQSLMRDEELYQARKRSGGGMSRSNSGLSITGAMGLAAKRRYDNVLVSRRKGSLDGDRPSDVELSARSLTTLSGRAKLAPKRRKRPLPSVVPAVASNLTKVESEAEADVPMAQSPVGLLDSPFAPSQCSSTTSSNAGSALPSPVDLIVPLPADSAQDGTLRQSDMLGVAGEDYRPKRARSMADNVRYFFTSRPASPSSSSGHHSPTPPPTVPQEPEAEPQTSLVQWWRKGSLRRRVQSTPDMPQDEPQPVIPGRASEDSRGSFLMQIPSSRDHISTPPSAYPNSPANSRKVGVNDTPLSRRRSLFAQSTRRDSSPQPSLPAASPAMPRRTLRNVLFFQRSNSFTPMDNK